MAVFALLMYLSDFNYLWFFHNVCLILKAFSPNRTMHKSMRVGELKI